MIGQGIAGSLLALNLEEQGKDYLIIDQGLHNGSSIYSGAVLNPLGLKRPSLTWLATEAFPYALERYETLVRKLRIDEPVFSPRTILHPLFKSNQWIAWEKKLFDTGSKKARMSHFAKLHDNGTSFFAGHKVLEVQGAHLDTKTFLQHLRQYFQKKGKLVEAPVELNKSQLESRFLDLKHLDRGSIQYKNMILCTGAWDLWSDYSPIPLKPVKGEYIEIENYQLWSLLENQIISAGINIIPLEKEGQIKIGSNYQWDFDHGRPSPHQAHLFLDQFNSRFSDLFGLHLDPNDIRNHVAGIRPSSFDRRPIMGLLNEELGLHVFSGLGTRGIMLAPYLSKLMGQHLLEKAPLPEEVQIKAKRTRPR